VPGTPPGKEQRSKRNEDADAEQSAERRQEGQGDGHQ
jgi:hypothetical protein